MEELSYTFQPYKSQWLRYVPPALILKISVFFLHFCVPYTSQNKLFKHLKKHKYLGKWICCFL